MAGRIRTEDEKAALCAEAARRRRAGEQMIDISRALDVPVSTLHRWAQEQGWRLHDIADEAEAPLFIPRRGVTDGAGDMADDDTGYGGELPDDVDTVDMARAVMARAAQHAAAGAFVKAESATRLAERLLRVAAQMGGMLVDPTGQAPAQGGGYTSPYDKPQRDGEAARAELRRRLERIRQAEIDATVRMADGITPPNPRHYINEEAPFEVQLRLAQILAPLMPDRDEEIDDPALREARDRVHEVLTEALKQET